MLKIKVIYFSFLILSLHLITTVRGAFDLEKGKELTRGIFSEISYMFGNEIEYASTINNAESVDALITNANSILNEDQAEDINDIARTTRKDFLQTLQTFINSFNSLLEQASITNKNPPLQYLLNMMKKKED